MKINIYVENHAFLFDVHSYKLGIRESSRRSRPDDRELRGAQGGSLLPSHARAGSSCVRGSGPARTPEVVVLLTCGHSDLWTVISSCQGLFWPINGAYESSEK